MTDIEMDLNLLYRDFVTAYQHPDPNLARDPLSTNLRLPETADLAMFGTMIVAGSTPDHITVLIPDTVGPTVDAESPVDLQHVVGLSLGPAANLSLTLPPADLALALCDNSLLPTLTLSRRDYWDYWDDYWDEKMAVHKRRQMPGMRPANPSKYVAPPMALTHVLPVFLALPRSVMPDVVCFRAQRKGSFRADPQFHRGTWLFIL